MLQFANFDAANFQEEAAAQSSRVYQVPLTLQRIIDGRWNE